jgi:hypothetical protein
MISPNYCFFAGFLLLTTTVFAQSEREKDFNQVVTLENAYQFINKYASQKIALHVLNSLEDTSAIDRKLYQLKVGEIARINGSVYKVIKDTIKYRFRASYIYLDGSKLTISVIDSLRTVILKKYAEGIPFDTLSDQYTMDGNPNHGDITFVTGMMVKKFEDQIRLHAMGEIFTVDVPENSWYYVAKKTADNQVVNVVVTVLEMD